MESVSLRVAWDAIRVEKLNGQRTQPIQSTKSLLKESGVRVYIDRTGSHKEQARATKLILRNRAKCNSNIHEENGERHAHKQGIERSIEGKKEKHLYKYRPSCALISAVNGQGNNTSCRA